MVITKEDTTYNDYSYMPEWYVYDNSFRAIIDDRCLAYYPDVLLPNEARKVLRIGTNSIYDLISSGELHALKVGTKYLIPKKCLEFYIQSCYNQQTDSIQAACAEKERKVS